jgi:hypothetical protein
MAPSSAGPGRLQHGSSEQSRRLLYARSDTLNEAAGSKLNPATSGAVPWRQVFSLSWIRQRNMLLIGKKKLRQLEEENTRLRKVVADLTLDKEMLTSDGIKPP